MGHGKTILLVLRVLALIVALAVVGLGAWMKFIMHDVDVRGTAILEIARLAPQSLQTWREYFSSVLSGVVLMWISIAAAAFASLAGVVIGLANILDGMRMSPAVLAPIECLCTCAMAASFGTALSFTLSLDAFSATRLDASTSVDLMNFAILVDLSKGYAIAAGTGGLLFLITCIMATADACNRAREKESCSFEPTASALGMGYGYAAITVPPTSRSRVPTMYDPRLPLRFDDSEEKKLERNGTQEKDSAIKDVETGRADSVVSQEGRIEFEFEKEITGPLSLEKPGRVLQIRPSRPWSELPVTRKVRVDDGIHAI